MTTNEPASQNQQSEDQSPDTVLLKHPVPVTHPIPHYTNQQFPTRTGPTPPASPIYSDQHQSIKYVDHSFGLRGLLDEDRHHHQQHQHYYHDQQQHQQQQQQQDYHHQEQYETYDPQQQDTGYLDLSNLHHHQHHPHQRVISTTPHQGNSMDILLSPMVYEQMRHSPHISHHQHPHDQQQQSFIDHEGNVISPLERPASTPLLSNHISLSQSFQYPHHVQPQRLSSIQHNQFYGVREDSWAGPIRSNSVPPKRRLYEADVDVELALQGVLVAAPLVDQARDDISDEEKYVRVYKCPGKFCSKVYKNANGLKYHLDRGVCELDSTDPSVSIDTETASAANLKIISKPYWCRIHGCGKKYKNLNGLKYHAKVAHKELDFISQVKGHHAIEQMGEEGAMIQQMTLPQKQSPQQQQTYDAGYDGDAKYEEGINGYNDNLNEGLSPLRLQRQD